MADPNIAYGNPSAESYAPFHLFAGDRPVATKTVTISSGSNLAQYSVLGRVDATGEYVLCNNGASDGSQVPRAILCQACDATSADTKAAVYVSGFFNHAALVWHASFDTLAEKLSAFDAGNHSISVGELTYSVG